MLLGNVIFPAPAYVYALGIFAWPVAILLLWAECITIWLVQRRTQMISVIFKYTLLANVASTLAGVAILCTVNLPTGYDKKWHRTPEYWMIAKIAVGTCYMLSILVEGAVYKWLKIAGAPTRPWASALAANTVSYGVIFVTTL